MRACACSPGACVRAHPGPRRGPGTTAKRPDHRRQQPKRPSSGAPPRLPDAYTTVLDERHGQRTRNSGGAVLTPCPWTDDDQLEVADREAIRRAEAARLSKHAQQQASLPPSPTVVTRLPSHLSPDVLANAMVLVDKPLGWEADEVARALKWALQVERMGYVGGLEGGSTGLLLLLMGKATALTTLFHSLGSRYTARLRLGVATDTYDAAGRATSVGPWQHVTDKAIQQVAAQLHGRHVQVPPAFDPTRMGDKSARPIYELVKHKQWTDLVSRPVHITSLSLEREQLGCRDLLMDVTFARAGYVRSLAHEVGQLLGCGAHATHVRREAMGGFLVDNAWSLDVLLPVAHKFGRRRKS